MMYPKPIVFTGFMCAGKSYYAAKIASKFDLACCDLDSEIENKIKMTIATFFDLYTEKEFRKIETETFRNFLFHKLCKTYIVSVGGGFTISEQNKKILHEHCHTVFIDTQIETILNRIRLEDHRPLLKNKNVDQITRLWHDRYPDYLSTADYKISDQAKLESVVEKILNQG